MKIVKKVTSEQNVIDVINDIDVLNAKFEKNVNNIKLTKSEKLEIKRIIDEFEKFVERLEKVYN